LAQARQRRDRRNQVGGLAIWLALLAAGCGGGSGQCSPACSPACGAGTICSSELNGHITAMRTGVCLTVCARPSDCSGELRCRSFSGGPPFVCASDSVPALCPPNQTTTDDIVGDLSTCIDAQTIALEFESPANATRGREMQTCANGCETVTVNNFPTSRCR
jgi:hypothetical protein